MTNKDLLYAITSIDDELVEKSESYRAGHEKKTAGHQSFYRRTVPIAVCVLAVLIFGFFGVFTKTGQHFPAVTAYAISKDGEVIQNKLSASKKIPVSIFTLKNNVSVFVFSYENEDKNAWPESILITDSALVNKDISFSPVKESEGNIYVYYITPQKAPPYNFGYTIFFEESKVCDIEIEITKTGNDYFASATFVTERASKAHHYNNTTEPETPTETENIDKLIKPYVDVLEKLNEKYGWRLAVFEEDKEKFYNTYKNCSLDEFENEIKKEMAEIGYEAK